MRPGTIVADRYEIVSLLGRGGMGAVYRVRHLTLGKELALKILRAGASDFEARFDREARALARLDHPNCVRVLDYGRTNSHHFIAMELCAGETLGGVLKTASLSVVRALHVARGLLAALSHAHAHGILHRDVKPENVVLVGARPVLIDFGLAVLEDEAALTGAGMCLGSPSYIAPERLLGRGSDARTDVYAVGVILYEMLAGVRPFAGDSPEQTMQLALTRPPRPLRAMRRDIPRELDAVVTRALAKEPARRFATADEMALALADVPILEDLAALALERVDEASTAALVRFEEPAWWQRAWSWLRYGGWRWARHECRGLPEPVSSRTG
ncbi:MAG TPA: serine/threonine-protein kinase [Kofleriaceae bacterium]|nr:serine/threonine-protein kinase [Kofleriaceae bacterium]